MLIKNLDVNKQKLLPRISAYMTLPLQQMTHVSSLKILTAISTLKVIYLLQLMLSYCY